jgi:hypothetical protein
VVPSSLLVERILSRLVSGRGHASELLMAMMSIHDGIYLRSIELGSEHHLLGKKFGDVLNTWCSDGRVLGLLPFKSRERYKNESEDFDTHFAMAPTKDEKGLELKEKDVVIVLGFPQNDGK